MTNTNVLIYTKPTREESYSLIRQRLTRRNIIKCLRFYGFVECAKISIFLSEVVEDDIDIPAYRYLLACLNECLHNHAQGYSDEASLKYFRPLLKLRDEIDFVTSIA